MEKANEQRTEQRLQYRWPVRFSNLGNKEPYQGQIVDLSSKGMSFLCHVEQNRFETGDSVKINFGVPFFRNTANFDTILFERIGQISRIDKPGSHVCRIALQFASPLFLKPGEQGINEIDIEQRLDTKKISVLKAEEKARASNHALDQAQKQLRIYAQAKAMLEEKLKAEIEDRANAEANLRAETEEKARFFIEKTARLEEKLHIKEKDIVKLTAFAENMENQVKLLEGQLREIKEKAEKEVARIKAEASDMIRQIKEVSKDDSKSFTKKDLLKKVDKFISDRNKIF